MFRSLHWRIYRWYALMLFTAIFGSSALLFSIVRRESLHRVEAELVGTARMLGGALEVKGAKKPKRGHSARLDNREHNPNAGVVVKRSPKPKNEGGKAELKLPGKFLHPLRHGKGVRTYYAIWDRRGQCILASSDELRSLPAPRPPKGPELKEYRLAWHSDEMQVILKGPHGTAIMVGRSLRSELDRILRLGWTFAGVGVLFLFAGLTIGWYSCKRALTPIKKITQTAETISANNLEARINVGETESELGRLAEILNNAFSRLQEAFARQVRFTADASHELRTPLSVILSQAEHALARPREVADYCHSLEAIHRAAARMRTLVTDLLTLSRADSGRLLSNQAVWDFADIVTESVNGIRDLGSARGILLETELESVHVEGDSMQLAELVTNLLANAILYNVDGGRVEVRLRHDQEIAMAVLSVSDTGIGIDQRHLPHVFERFYRVDAARTRTVGGSGLGLALVKEIAEAHGGMVRIASKPGMGTTVLVLIPHCAV